MKRYGKTGMKHSIALEDKFHCEIMERLTNNEKERYSRMISLPEMGDKAILNLKRSKILVIGAGGLGSATIPVLAAAGVGALGLVEFDKVENSNLQRQLLYSPSDIGKEKIRIASQKARQLNPGINLTEFSNRIDETNCKKIIEGFDLVLDCTDNFPTRYLINDTCASLKKPLIYSSVSDYEGLVTILHNRNNINLRDIFPGMPKKQAAKGIVPTLPMIIGSIQANEAIKMLTQTGDILDGKLLSYNIQTNSYQVVTL
mgnify:CR=1 FL=1